METKKKTDSAHPQGWSLGGRLVSLCGKTGPDLANGLLTFGIR